MIEKQNKIIEKINNLDEIKKYKSLKEKLKQNEYYQELINTEINNKNELVEVRKKLFEIDDFKEYQKLYSKIKLDFQKINKMIISVVDNRICNENHLN